MRRPVPRRAMLGGVTLLALGSACSTDRGGAGGSATGSGGMRASSGAATSSAAASGMPSAAPGVTVRAVGTGSKASRMRYRTMAQRAVDPVESVWGRGTLPRQITVNVPHSAAEFTRIAGATREVPAVTLPNRHVVIHPDLASRTSAVGQEVVLRHELSHVALDQGSWASVPKWVVEGSAEYAAYRDQDLTPAQVAPGLARRVRAGDRFAGPPDDVTVEGTDGYSLAWSWCVYLVQQHGDSQFVRFVRAVAEDRSQDGALRTFRAAYDTTPERLSHGYSTWLASWL